MGDSDMDMDSGSDFDVGSDSDLDSGFDMDTDSDMESLDSLDDVGDSSLEDLSLEVDNSSVDLESLDLDFPDESVEELDLQNDITEASDSSEDLLSDLDEVPNIDSLEDSSDLDVDTSDDEIEMLEMDDDLREVAEASPETDISLEPLVGTEEISDEHLDLSDTNDELDSLDLPEMDSSASESIEGLGDTQSELQELEAQTEEIVEDVPDVLYPGQELTDVPPECFGDIPGDISEELGISEEVVEEMDSSPDEAEFLSENTDTELGAESELESLSLEELTDPVPETVENELEELSLPEEEMIENPEEALETIQAERDRLTAIRDELTEIQTAETDETDEETDEESPLVRTREITDEILESRERDTEEVLDNYRGNLREYGVAEEQIEEFVTQEREKIDAEYESLDRGDEYPQMYEAPSDWESLAASLMEQDVQDELSDELPQVSDIQDQPLEELGAESQELEINYDEIYEGIQQEALEQGFENIQIDADPERLDQSLENFSESAWANLSLEEQKDSMSSLAEYVVDVIGFEHPPTIEYYDNPQEGDFGGYNAATNTLQINEYMLYNSPEAADTIAHELWHAHQHECALSPQSARDYQYQYNFENYIPPSLGQEAYESQLVEAEARAFAAQFKDRLSQISGRSR